MSDRNLRTALSAVSIKQMNVNSADGYPDTAEFFTLRQCVKCKRRLALDQFKTKQNGAVLKRCIECNEKQWKWAQCPHGIAKSQCAACHGGISPQICTHGKRRHRCTECHGGILPSHCEHGRDKWQCIPCGGSQVCSHARRRSNCKLCAGSQVCLHGIQRSVCKSCNGVQRCAAHQRIKSRCNACRKIKAREMLMAVAESGIGIYGNLRGLYDGVILD